jgi:holo-[acyl-carrier protein] synthase
LVIGIGIDIVEIKRLRRALERWPRLYERLFTPEERALCSSSRMKFARLAGRFAAKEAIAKALGRPLSWRDVEIVRESKGKPVAVFYSKAKAATRGLEVLVSISHGKEYAVAQALALKKPHRAAPKEKVG